MTNGRVGYIHIYDMGWAIREFIKWYYPQLDKEGLVVDVALTAGMSANDYRTSRRRKRWR